MAPHTSPHFLSSLREALATHADRRAIEYRGRTIRYALLESLVSRAAAWLQAQGVLPGDRVALASGNKLPFLIAHLGALFSGAAPLPLNPRYTREELRYFLSDSQTRLVVAEAETRPMIAELAESLLPRPVVAVDQVFLDLPEANSVAAEVPADSPALLMYSSGTTGFPKGVLHTQTKVDGSLRALANCWQINEDDVVVNALPLFHIHGLAFATHLTLLAGGCVLLADTFDAPEFVRMLGQATICMAVPTMYYKLLDEPSFLALEKAPPPVRLYTCGSAPIRAELLPTLQRIVHRPIINRYGMTEAYVITSLPLAGPWPDGSVGAPLEGMELKVANEDGSPMPQGEVGSVQVRSQNLFQRYWNKLEATEAAFIDGWFDTGDLGQLDQAGFLTLVGRKHDLIITHGYNVYPQVVERVIGECPGVRECAVVGLADAKRGEQVAVAVVGDSGSVDETRLRSWCEERLIHYQRPRTIVFVKSLPRNSLGKVLRRELRATLEAIAKP